MALYKFTYLTLYNSFHFVVFHAGINGLPQQLEKASTLSDKKSSPNIAQPIMLRRLEQNTGTVSKAFMMSFYIRL